MLPKRNRLCVAKASADRAFDSIDCLADPEVTHIGFLHSDDRLISTQFDEYLSHMKTPRDMRARRNGQGQSTRLCVLLWWLESCFRFVVACQPNTTARTLS
jgi:hypothetical protein